MNLLTWGYNLIKSPFCGPKRALPPTNPNTVTSRQNKVETDDVSKEQTIEINLFKMDKSSIGNNNVIDMSNASFIIEKASKNKSYRPKNPVESIKKHMKNRTTMQNDIKKMSFIFYIIPLLRTGKQLKQVLKALRRNYVAFGALLIGLDRGPDRLDKCDFHMLNDWITYVTTLPTKARGITTFDKVAKLRYDGYMQNKLGVMNCTFLLVCIYEEWMNLKTYNIICMLCSLKVHDDVLFLTQDLRLTGESCLTLKPNEVYTMAKYHKYEKKHAKFVCRLVKVIKRVVLCQNNGWFSSKDFAENERLWSIPKLK